MVTDLDGDSSPIIPRGHDYPEVDVMRCALGEAGELGLVPCTLTFPYGEIIRIQPDSRNPVWVAWVPPGELQWRQYRAFYSPVTKELLLHPGPDDLPDGHLPFIGLPPRFLPDGGDGQ